MNKRIVSLLMCASLLVSLILPILPRSAAAENGESVRILLDGTPVSEIQLLSDEKQTLTAQAGGADAWQWQLLLDAQLDLWVNIYDKTQQSCEISYALVKNLLDSSNSAYIRCAATLGGQTHYSDPVCITIQFVQSTGGYAQVDMVLISDLQVLQSQPPATETVPAEAATEAASEPAEAAQIAEETTAPTQADTEISGFSLRTADSQLMPAEETTASAEQTEPGTEYVTVTIKYLDDSSLDAGATEASIYSPYTATIEKGSNFFQTVISPTYLGFAPYWDGNIPGYTSQDTDGDGQIDEDASSITLALTNVTEDLVLNVYYIPIEVTFAVRYYFQNISDDLYTENAGLYYTGKAITGTIITDDELLSYVGNSSAISGFSMMYHIPESVAADGSTVFECYFDRNYYLLQFDLNGGYGVDPIYARYGTPFVVNAPIRHGYNFLGWDLLTADADGDGVMDTGDGTADTLPGTIPANNLYYRALWQNVDTTYSIVYWLDNGDDTYSYIGGAQKDAVSGDLVSGSDDLSSAAICGQPGHTHSDSCYGCNAPDHVCTIDCYSESATLAENITNNTTQNAYDAFVRAVGNNASERYVYKYRPQNGNTYYNFFFFGGEWYYLGTGNSYGGIRLSGTLNNPSRNNYNSVAAAECTDGHTHTNACIACGLTEHIHSSACGVDTSYYTFVSADQNVRVEGDGSTVVNVYYAYKTYTLKFYYAMSSGSGNNTTYYIVGGTTYYFGSWGTAANNADEISLLDTYMSTYAGHVGKVDELPTLNAIGAARNYTHGTDTSRVNGTDYTYYYISFTAPYGSDISQLWPCNVFNSVTRTDKNNANGWSGTEAFVSAWNGEHNVSYSQDNSNQTIKGNYMRLDSALLWDSSYGDSDTVAYLCFWENGANIDWSVPELYRYNVYVTVLPGQDTTGLTTTVKNGVTYYLLATYDTCDNSTVAEQTAPAINGYTYLTRDSKALTNYDTSLYKEAYDVNFYYTRGGYTLTFYNYNATVSGAGGDVSFGTAMEDYYFIPDYPSTLEENAYYFGGWYTTEGCYPGSEFGNFQYDSAGNYVSSDFIDQSTPAYDLILYANWVPKTHTVNFFTTYDDMRAYEAGDGTVVLHDRFTDITHGNVVGSVTNPQRSDSNLVFTGWFYMENGEKKAFSPTNMPINRDMNIFADWSSSSPQPYRIEYVLRTDPSVHVADNSVGYAYYGSTRTFNAKAGNPYNQLYSAYNTGYFPTVSSHSITMQYESDGTTPETAEKNIYTFYYVQAQEISYTVRYVNAETNVLMGQDVYRTFDSVVTARFKAFENMVPDAFYKRLVLSVEEDENGNWVGTEDNVITFYYTPNETSAYYAVHFMLEKENATDEEKQDYSIDGSGGYEENNVIIQGTGTIGTDIPITPQEFSGFAVIPDQAVEIRWNTPASNGSQTYESDTVTPSGDGTYSIEVTANGTELYIFYRRINYDYVVYYYRYNTTQSLAEPSTGSKYFGATVSAAAKEIDGYTCVSQTQQSMTIREDGAIVYDDAGNVVSLEYVQQNVIIFYYAETQYTVEYVAVPSEGGILSSTIEVITGTDHFSGSTATANRYYAFEGWYLDPACTIAVGSDIATTSGSNNQTLTPIKSALSATTSNIFYAKFIKQAGDLTVTRTDAADSSQVFVYQIENNATGETICVTVTGNGSVTVHDLPFGSYTVTQQNDWSWRYADASQTVSHEDLDGTTVQFKAPVTSTQWLSGSSLPAVNEKKKESQEGDEDA